MLGRLWWKEGRSFGPVALLLLGAAGVIQWLLIGAGNPIVRRGFLTPADLTWAVLYAFAVGSAAFSGEREARTLGFLDALPVGRPTLWLGKATFALGSTLGLALLLAGLASIGTLIREPQGEYNYIWMVQLFGTLLFEAVAWGLFWSAVSKNPLMAGVLSVLSVGVVSLVTNRFIMTMSPVASSELLSPEAIPIRLLAGLAALLLSGVAITRRPLKVKWPTRFRFDLREIRRARVASIPRASVARSLVWQTVREGWTIAFLVGLLGLALPIGIVIPGIFPEAPGLVILGWLAVLVAGVAVFGTEGGSATPRFLVHHGVRPGGLWFVKVLIWGLGMVGFSTILLAVLWSGNQYSPAIGRWGTKELVAATLADVFLIGLVCGMTITRRITAVLVGVIGVIVLVPIQIVLVTAMMIPNWSLWLTPAILLGISRAWVADWMGGRQGFGPWVRLALLIVVPFGLLGSTYVSWRAWGEPDLGPQSQEISLNTEVFYSRPEAANAYREARGRMSPSPRLRESGMPGDAEVVEQGWSLATPDFIHWWKANQDVIGMAREASKLPGAQFGNVLKRNYGSMQDPGSPDVFSLAHLVALDARERLSRPDLPGAWEDILTMFRMSDQLSRTTPTLAQMLASCKVHHRATALAIDWSGHPGQTSELLKSARNDLKQLPPRTTVERAIRVEALLLDRTFQLPLDDLEPIVNEVTGGVSNLPFFREMVTWWERERATRVCRRLIAEILREAALEPSDRPLNTHFDAPPVGSPLARLLFPTFGNVVHAVDMEVVRHRAVEQILAIESWRSAHGGTYPESLEALVPEFLDRLPIDPFSGRPFGYVRSEGQPFRPPILEEFGPSEQFRPTRTGQPILYSVGPDRVDDMKRERVEVRLKGLGDLVFPIPGFVGSPPSERQ